MSAEDIARVEGDLRAAIGTLWELSVMARGEAAADLPEGWWHGALYAGMCPGGGVLSAKLSRGVGRASLKPKWGVQPASSSFPASDPLPAPINECIYFSSCLKGGWTFSKRFMAFGWTKMGKEWAKNGSERGSCFGAFL